MGDQEAEAAIGLVEEGSIVFGIDEHYSIS
jgi:hypothetical protein